MKLRQVYDFASVEEAQHAGLQIDTAIVVPFMGEKIVLCNNRWRGWEFPGGGVEWGESVQMCARRELREETGAEYDRLQFVRVIWLERNIYRSFKAALYFAEVNRLRPHADFYEIYEVDTFDTLPDSRFLSFECEDELYQLALTARQNQLS